MQVSLNKNWLLTVPNLRVFTPPRFNPCSPLSWIT